MPVKPPSTLAPTSKRRRNQRGPSKRVYKARKTALALARRANQQIAHELHAAAPERLDRCQHPRSRARGMCQSRAVTVKVGNEWVPAQWQIPADYVPERRHAGQPDVSRPTARLCPQHKFVIDTWVTAQANGDQAGLSQREGGDGRTADWPHTSRCDVCAKLRATPDLQRVIDRWTKYHFSAGDAAMDLGVNKSTFMRHIEYYGLDKLRGDKPAREQVLQEVMEAGVRSARSGKVSAKDAVAAAAALGKLRGDVAENVNVQAAVVNLGELDNAALLKRMAELGRKLAELEGAKP
jgi:hypothetical protein